MNSGGPQEPCIRWGPRSPQGKGQFFWGRTPPAIQPFVKILGPVVTGVADAAGSMVKSCRRLRSPHKAADAASRRLLSPLSLEAQFVRDVLDHVSTLSCHRLQKT